jgi:hypothetical protein
MDVGDGLRLSVNNIQVSFEKDWATRIGISVLRHEVWELALTADVVLYVSLDPDIAL